MLPPVVPDLVPVHVPPKLASFKVTLLGNVSTNALLNVAKLALLLLNVIVSTLVPLGAIDAGLKLLDTVGALKIVRFAVAKLALFPTSVCNDPTPIVFV